MNAVIEKIKKAFSFLFVDKKIHKTKWFWPVVAVVVLLNLTSHRGSSSASSSDSSSASSEPDGWYELVCKNSGSTSNLASRKVNCDDKGEVIEAIHDAYSFLRSNRDVLQSEMYENNCFEAYNEAKEVPDGAGRDYLSGFVMKCSTGLIGAQSSASAMNRN